MPVSILFCAALVLVCLIIVWWNRGKMGRERQNSLFQPVPFPSLPIDGQLRTKWSDEMGGNDSGERFVYGVDNKILIRSLASNVVIGETVVLGWRTATGSASPSKQPQSWRPNPGSTFYVLKDHPGSESVAGPWTAARSSSCRRIRSQAGAPSRMQASGR